MQQQIWQAYYSSMITLLNMYVSYAFWFSKYKSIDTDYFCEIWFMTIHDVFEFSTI